MIPPGEDTRPRLAAALLAALPFLGTSSPAAGHRVTRHQRAGIVAREELKRYAHALIAEDCQRDLTPEESRVLHEILETMK